jgi:Mrp family chromosome partitioning ATPase
MARIAARATPPLRRSSPRPLAALIAALAAGLAIGMGGALSLEHRARFRARQIDTVQVLEPTDTRLDVVKARPVPSATRVDAGPTVASQIALSPEPPETSRLQHIAAMDAERVPAPAAISQALPVARPAVSRGDAIAVLPRLDASRAAPPAGSRWSGQVAHLVEVRTNGHSDFSRAVHELCSEIMRDFSNESIVKILVTSLEAGAGKSVLAANLGQAAAEAGERVLLIDANSLHPTISALAPHDEPPALISLSGTLRLAYRLWTGSGSLHLIPLSPAEKRLTRRLVRDQSTEFIEGITDNFDLIIVDGPVARSGEEPMALVAAADELIVVGGMQTDMSAVQPLLRKMRAQGKFRGIVRVERDDEAQVA